ncbi:histone-fold-containing protein [Kockiozyma suomiensis]|uniref:histone-fold-containing protein n=1 Tax=Kockiozyma suomiensis TaxID=1337062 RepID=UPI003342F3C8
MYSDSQDPQQLAQQVAQQQQHEQQQHEQQPVQYEQILESGGHYGAAAAVAASGGAPAATFVGGAFANVAQGLSGQYRNIMMSYWQETINSIERDEHEFKIHQLPLARIKKVMKADEDVKMISAEAPILFAKGCDIFITELTMRAWIHAEENKRRTLQRSDIANALQKSDMFDFLIDIVPREEAVAASRKSL